MKGDFEDIVDKQLLVWGRRLAARLKLLRALTIMLVLVIGIFYIGAQVR